MTFHLGALAAAAAVLLAACGSSQLPIIGQKACTEIGCENGVRVDFTYREPGSYTVVVVVDGVSTTCEATLPLPRGASEPCDREAVLLALIGSELPADQQSIGGLILPNATDAKSITVQVTRDGTLLGEKTFTPTYQVTPGPNGPDCEPKECKLATTTFP